jgi:hypothetical protein
MVFKESLKEHWKAGAGAREIGTLPVPLSTSGVF